MEPEQPQQPEPTEFQWFDESDARRWRKRIRHNRAYLVACPLMAVLALAMPPALGIVVGVFVSALSFLRAVRRYDDGFENKDLGATAVVTEDKLTLTRPDGTALDLEMADVAGYTIDLTGSPNLRIHRRKDDPVDFRVYFAEVHFDGLWDSLGRLERFLPKHGPREVIDLSQPTSVSDIKRTAFKLLWGGTASVVVSTTTILLTVYTGLSGAWIEISFVGTVVLAAVGLALLVCSAIAFRRYRVLSRATQDIVVPGNPVAYFPPDIGHVANLRAFASLALVFSLMFTIIAVSDPRGFWFGFLLGPAVIVLVAYLLHVAALESRTVIVTDQYVAVVNRGRQALLRHGQYEIFRGSFWMGVYLKIPDNAFILVSDGFAVSFTNRANKDGFALNRIAEFSDEATELAAALGAD